jgi:hypothetical protein
VAAGYDISEARAARGNQTKLTAESPLRENLWASLMAALDTGTRDLRANMAWSRANHYEGVVEEQAAVQEIDGRRSQVAPGCDSGAFLRISALHTRVDVRKNESF